LIKRFYQYWTDGREPNWSKLRVLHGWGGVSKEGLYSSICEIIGVDPKSFSEARDFFEQKRNSELFGMCCYELMQYRVPQIYDAILMDEAQDFDKYFFQLCHKILKPPKRLIWAYDELQSLEDISIPTAIDIFGVDKNDVPLVDLDGVYQGGIEKDFVLHRSYRNPKIILMTAHIFGMGLMRKGGPVQFIPNAGAWEDIGYKIVDGNLTIGTTVKITRPDESSPNVIERFVPPQDLVKLASFKNEEEQLDWIAEQIESDIKKDNLLPEDILEPIGFVA